MGKKNGTIKKVPNAPKRKYSKEELVAACDAMEDLEAMFLGF